MPACDVSECVCCVVCIMMFAYRVFIAGRVNVNDQGVK